MPRTSVSKKNALTVLAITIGLLAMGSGIATAGATLSASFTYQGLLLDNGVPYNGLATVSFALYDAPVAGNLIASGVVVPNPVQVNDGLMTVCVDFGVNAFDGGERWVEITVNEVLLLSGRQPIKATPYALHALEAAPIGSASGDLTGSYPGPMIANGAVTGPKIGADAVASTHLASDPDSLEKVSGGLVLIDPGNDIRFLDTIEIQKPGDFTKPRLVSFVDPFGDTVAVFNLEDGEAYSLHIKALPSHPFLFLSTGNATAAPIRCFSPGTGDWYRLQAASFEVMSSRELKRNIEYLDNADQAQILQQVLALRPARYSFRWQGAMEAPDEAPPPHMGLIAEDLPPELLNASGDAVDLYALVTAAVAAIKQSRLESEREIDRLRAQKDREIESLTARLKTLEVLVERRLAGVGERTP